VNDEAGWLINHNHLIVFVKNRDTLSRRGRKGGKGENLHSHPIPREKETPRKGGLTIDRHSAFFDQSLDRSAGEGC
jgi:hypothetical protein